MEEEVLRDASGHTHLDSSPHLDTFMRVMGDRPYPVSETFVTSAGRRTHPPSRKENEVQLPTKRELASRRMKELSAYMSETCMFRSTAIDAAALEAALNERREDKNVSANAEQEKCTNETESAAKYKFHVPQVQEAKLLSPEETAQKYFQQQVRSGTPEGAELVSRWTELANIRSSSVQQTSCKGQMMFAKNNSFSIPVQNSLQGLCKDSEALGILERSLRSKSETHPASTGGLQPALQAFKQRLREAIKAAKGCLGFLILKAVLKELSDVRGLVPAEAVEQFLWQEFGVQTAHIPMEHLRSALKILTLVDKTSIRISDLVEFIWVPIESCRRNILVAFHRVATSSKDIVAAGSSAATVRITHPRPLIQLTSIPEFLHPFLNEKDSSGQVALPLILEALVDLSQGIADDASFLATVCDIAEKEGFHLQVHTVD